LATERVLVLDSNGKVEKEITFSSVHLLAGKKQTKDVGVLLSESSDQV
jgi:hypothetical protein